MCCRTSDSCHHRISSVRTRRRLFSAQRLKDSSGCLPPVHTCLAGTERGLSVSWTTIIKSHREREIVPHLSNYETISSRFSWDQARQELDGLFKFCDLDPQDVRRGDSGSRLLKVRHAQW